jgi:hypothetical protein
MSKNLIISYAITVCSEEFELNRLLSFLIEHKREQDEIVILYDSVNGSIKVEEYLRSRSVVNPKFRWHSYKFDKDFSKMKNHLTDLCDGDIIFNIDADEVPHKYLIEQLPYLTEYNPDADMFLVPRINKVSGITQEHINRWGWRVDENSWINYPDYQSRIYKNSPNIRWEGKVHEKIQGCKMYAALPADESWSLYHYKTIEKQEKQNALYNAI